MTLFARPRRPRRLSVETLELRIVLSGAAYRPSLLDLIAAEAAFEHDDGAPPRGEPPAAIGRPSFSDESFRGDHLPPAGGTRGPIGDFGMPRPWGEPAIVSLVIFVIPVSTMSSSSVSTWPSWSTGTSTSVANPSTVDASLPIVTSKPTASSVTSSSDLISRGEAEGPPSGTPIVATTPNTRAPQDAAFVTFPRVDSRVDSTVNPRVGSLSDSRGVADDHAWRVVDLLWSDSADSLTWSSAAESSSLLAEIRGSGSREAAAWMTLPTSVQASDRVGPADSEHDSEQTTRDGDWDWSATLENELARERVASVRQAAGSTAAHRRLEAAANPEGRDAGRSSPEDRWQLTGGEQSSRPAESIANDGRWIELPVSDQPVRSAHGTPVTRRLAPPANGMASQPSEVNETDGAEPTGESSEGAPNASASSPLAVSTLFVALASAWPYRQRVLNALASKLRRRRRK